MTDTISKQQIEQIFLDKWGIQLYWYEDQYSRMDGWFIWKDKRYEIELKRRRFDSNQYPTTIVNLDKFKELISNKGILIILFNDRWCVTTNPASTYLKVTSMYARQTTDFGGEWQWSEKVELDLNSFKWFDYD